MKGLPRLAGALTATLLLLLLAARSCPPPAGAVAALRQSAAELRVVKSYAASVEAYEQIAALVPGNPEPLLAIGDIYLGQRRWLLAADAFNRALARQMALAPAWAGLASASWWGGDRVRAVTQWQIALTYLPDLMPARLGLARAYLALDRQSDAEATLRAGLSLVGAQSHDLQNERDEAAAAHVLLAALLALDDPAGAGARQELSVIPDDASAPILARREYLRETLDLAAAAASLAESARRLGLAFAQAEMWPLARTALARALELNPADAEAMAFLGHAEAQLGHPALEHLMRAVAMRPDWPPGHSLLGLYYLQNNLPGAAAVQMRAVVRLDPGNAQASLDLSRAYVAQGKYHEAEAALDAAVAAAPGDLRFRLSQTRFYADASWRVADRGLAAAQAAAALAPQDPEARDLLGWLHVLAGDFPQARLHLLSALNLDPDRASTTYHLGELYRAWGLSEQARFAFQRTIDLDTEGWARERAQQQLNGLTQGK